MEEIFDLEKRSFHNDRAAKIVRSWSKPAKFKVKRDACLKIENRLARLYVVKSN